MTRYILTSILCIVMSIATSAQTEVTSDIAKSQLEQIRQAGAGLHTITAQYDMTRQAPLMADLIKDHGLFYYSAEAGGVCLMSTTRPKDRTVMTSELFISESEGQSTRLSAQKNPVMSQMLNLICGCLSGDFEQLAKQGKLTYLKDSDSFIIQFRPTGKRVTRFLRQISLTFSTKDYSLVRLRMTQNDNLFTEYTFTDKKYNLVVDDSLFK